MDNGEAAPDRSARLRTGRLEAFSDGVFAIAITLLVLELTVPAGSESDLLGAFLDQWRSYLAYLVSFLTIGAVWLAHSVITEFIGRADAVLLRLNLLLLMVVSFLPFPTRLLAEYTSDHDAAAWRPPSTESPSSRRRYWCRSCGATHSAPNSCDPTPPTRTCRRSPRN